MQPSDSAFAIKPRSTWEALDLGILLAGRYRRTLTLAWACATLPLFVLLMLLLWESPGWVAFFLWWSKPAFDRLLLHILAGAVCAAPPGIAAALRHLPKLLKPQLIQSLLWRRFSLHRSFDLPVQQLEGLGGAQRRERLRMLHRGNNAPACWLTLLGANLETVASVGLILLLWAMIPAIFELPTGWIDLLESQPQDWLWLEHLGNLLYWLVLLIWEPIYVACGFSLYLNRRTVLEAWDLERAFRQLARRLVPGMALGAVLVFGLASYPPPSYAAPLAHQASRDAIHAITDRPPFTREEEVTRWRFEPLDGFTPDSGATLHARSNMLASIMAWSLWSALLGIAALFAWRHRQWLRVFVSRPPPPSADAPPAASTRLAPAGDALPDDIVQQARSMWPRSSRQAMSLLYRGMLLRLATQLPAELPLKPAHTEEEVLAQATLAVDPECGRYILRMTRAWQAAAYGHFTPDAATFEGLCRGWQHHFAKGERP